MSQDSRFRFVRPVRNTHTQREITMNRRDVVKMVAALSVLPFSKLAWAAGPKYGCPPDPGNDTFIHFIFHGLFFMQFDNDKLRIGAPRLSAGSPKHELLGGQLGHVVPINSDLDLSSSVKPGSVSDFSNLPTLPQFSLHDTGVTVDFSKARATITLLKPAAIFPLRPGMLSDLVNIMANGNVQQSLQRACGQGGNNDLAIAVCLRYQSAGPGSVISGGGPVTYHFYSESTMGGHNYQEMNMIYRDVEFKNMVKNFDLQLKGDPTHDYIPIKDGCSSGVSDEDQLSLYEVAGLQLLYQQQVELLQAAKVHAGAAGHAQAKNSPKNQQQGPPRAVESTRFNVKVADCIP